MCATSWHCVYAMSFFVRRSSEFASMANTVLSPRMRPQFSMAPVSTQIDGEARREKP